MKVFKTSNIKNGLIFSNEDQFGKTELYGAMDGYQLEPPFNATHFGIVLNGEIRVSIDGREREFFAGDYFSVFGKINLKSDGKCFIISQHNYKGMNIFGGPIEKLGRLKYIDGCTDSLLIPPVIKGDPCLNHLHFPQHITQTPHTHPSIRAGLVYRGRGESLMEEGMTVPLTEGSIFLLEKEVVHSFNTTNETMDIVVFHPDSDFGPEHDEHPMINRTMLDGISVKNKKEIRTTQIS
jgi:quercetin dioxygenase-like cupin family protein